MRNKLISIGTVCLVAVLTLVLALVPAHRVIAQQGFVGATQVPGFFALAVNSTTFSPALTTGAAGTVTNPSVGFVLQIDGGPLYCAGGEDNLTESNLTLAPNNTYLIVYNCNSNSVYAKTAITGPGSSGTSVGIPNQILAAIPGVEVALATVVCSATACGNGSGSITDARSTIYFPNGKQLSKIAFASLNASAPDGAMVICSSCTQPAAGSVTCTSGAVAVLAVRVAGAWRCF